MKKMTKNIKLIMFLYLIIGLFTYKNIMPISGSHISLDCEANIKKNIRKRIITSVKEDIIRIFLFIKNISTNFQQDKIPDEIVHLKTLLPELQIHIANQLPPRNRGKMMCCSKFFEENLYLEPTDLDFQNYPDDPLCLTTKIIDSITNEETLPQINKTKLIKLLRLGRIGMINKNQENMILDAYPNLINKHLYKISISCQASNPIIKSWGRLLCREDNLQKRRLLSIIQYFLLNRSFSNIFSYSSKSILNLDCIFNGISMLSQLDNKQQLIKYFLNILLIPIKKIGIDLTDNLLLIDNSIRNVRILNAPMGIMLIRNMNITKICIATMKSIEDLRRFTYLLHPSDYPQQYNLLHQLCKLAYIIFAISELPRFSSILGQYQY